MKDFNFKVFSSPTCIFAVFLVIAGVSSCHQVAESHSVMNSNTAQLTKANSERTEAQTEKTEIRNKDNSGNSNTSAVLPDDSIKQKDFKNFSYPWCSKIARLKDTITLKDGKEEIIKYDGKFVTNSPPHTQESYIRVDHIEYEIDKDIYYGDFNSDNITDAFVSITARAYSGEFAHATRTCSFIYTSKENKPKLIWKYIPKRK